MPQVLRSHGYAFRRLQRPLGHFLQWRLAIVCDKLQSQHLPSARRFREQLEKLPLFGSEHLCIVRVRVAGRVTLPLAGVLPFVHGFVTISFCSRRCECRRCLVIHARSLLVRIDVPPANCRWARAWELSYLANVFVIIRYRLELRFVSPRAVRRDRRWLKLAILIRGVGVAGCNRGP